MITPNIRGYDPQGAGHYGASRGKRTHNGIDFVCHAGGLVKAYTVGVVTKIGYPYNPSDIAKGHLRYVELTDSMGLRCRYFYVMPHVSFGDTIKSGEIIGKSQDLSNIYKGITPHYHFEVKTKQGRFINPHCYFELDHG